MTWPMFLAGGAIDCPGRQTSGTAGLFVQNAGGRCFALTVATVVPPGHEALYRSMGTRFRLGQAEALSSERVDRRLAAESLIVALPIPATVMIGAHLGGVIEGSLPRPYFEIIAKPLCLHGRSGPQPLGSVTMIGRSFALGGEDVSTEPYGGGFEVSYDLGAAPIAPGIAGSLVMTEQREPLGLVVGCTATSLIAAPLGKVLERLAYVPLTVYAATSHNAKAAALHALTARQRAHRKFLTGDMGLALTKRLEQVAHRPPASVGIEAKVEKLLAMVE